MQLSMAGYEYTTMAHVAASLGLKESVLKEYYPSKEDLLAAIYALYRQTKINARPNFDNILKVAETKHPHEVLMMLSYEIPDDISEFMTYALLLATQNINRDPESMDLVKNFTMGYAYEGVKKLLDKMMELGKIEPIDSKMFAKLISYYVFSNAVLERSMLGVTHEKYIAGLATLLQLVKPTGK